jgi:hypothetical protein
MSQLVLLCACIFSNIATLGLCAAWGDFLVCNKCDNFYKERARGPGGAAGEPEKEDSLAELAHLMNPKQVCASGICFPAAVDAVFLACADFCAQQEGFFMNRSYCDALLGRRGFWHVPC